MIDRELARLRATPGARLAVFMPPRHGKSELCSHWLPVWWLNQWPYHKVILTSYEATFAAGWGRRVRNTLEELGGRIAGDSAAAARWETPEGGGMVAVGVGGPITGRGADLLIIDDPVKNAEEANSRVYRERAWEWYRSTALTRLEPGGRVVLIQTRWHKDDLAGRILEHEADRWRILSLPALAESGDQMGREPGEALWPDRYPVDKLSEVERDIGPYWWSAMFQQSPTARDAGMFRRDMFHKCYIEDGWRVGDRVIPDGELRIYGAMDLAASTSETADYTVLAVVAATSSGQLLVLDIIRGRWEADEVLDRLARAQEQWQMAFIAVEDVAYQQAFLQMARRRGLPVTPAKARGDKITRAMTLQARAAAGDVFLREASWTDELLSELCDFPHGGHDDQVDALSYAAARVDFVMRSGLAGSDDDMASMRSRIGR